MAKPTLAIYGIQDVTDTPWPNMVHDHAMVLMQDGKVEKYLELERISRVKHDNKLHRQIYNLLKNEKMILPNAYDLIFVDAVVGSSFISADGQIRFEAPLSDTLQTSPQTGRAWWFSQQTKAYSLNHELAHIYSTVPFYGNFKENSLLVHFDGGASLSNFSAWVYRNQQLELLEFNWNLKYLSALFNSNALNYFILNVKRIFHNSLPGKYMGFASLGNYRPEIEVWLKENQYFSNIWKTKQDFFDSVQKQFGIKLQQFDTHNTFLQDIAATVQHIFTQDFTNVIRELQQRTQTNFLYYAGGSALSIVTNSAIQRLCIFEDIFIPPCTSDTGLALGAATCLEMAKGNTIQPHSAYLNNWGLPAELLNTADDVPAELIQKVASLLVEQKIIGICRGAGESGPRALGNRSILALANSQKLAQKVSMSCKKREWYRPVAPVMLEDTALRYIGFDQMPAAARYMLYDFEILPEYQKELEGVVHKNGTARIQTVSPESGNLFLLRLLQELESKYKVKALINTSFNGPGEPIVHQPNEAILAAKTMGLDAVVLGNKLYKLR